MLEREGRLPDAVVACVGGGSNAVGMFYPFVDDAEVELVGAEAGGAGRGRRARRQPDAGPPRRAARLAQLRAARTRTARCRRRTRSPPASTTRASAPSTATEGQRPGPVREHHRRRGARGLPPLPAARASSRRSSRPRRGPALASEPGRRARSCSSACPAAATRTSTRWRQREARRMNLAMPALSIYLMADRTPPSWPRRRYAAERRDRDRHPLLRPAGRRADRSACGAAVAGNGMTMAAR